MIEPYYEHAGITIYHCDCRDILPSLKADAVVTDPPYGTGETRSVGGRLSKGGRIVTTRQDWDVWWDGWLDAFDDHRPVALFSPPSRLPGLLGRGGRLLVWNRRSGMCLANVAPRYTFQPIVLLGRPPMSREADLFSEAGNKAGQHPHEKPLLVMHWLVRMVSADAQTILDPFMGSGTTLRAAKDLGRKAIGIEIEERYCEIAAKRLAQEVLPFHE